MSDIERQVCVCMRETDGNTVLGIYMCIMCVLVRGNRERLYTYQETCRISDAASAECMYAFIYFGVVCA